MAAPDRVITQVGSGPSVSGSIQDEITGLWNQSDIHLTTIAGTGNAITASMAPALTAGLTAGMKVSFVAAANNTGAATIAINGGTAIPLKTDDGAALISGQLVAGRLFRAVSDGTNLRIGGTSSILKVNDYQAFTASGTWTKPAGTPANALVTIHVWAGGGGGGTGTSGSVSGGGGGGYLRYQCKAGDLSSSVAITIGAGGTIANAGGSSSFGTLVTAFGGGAGINQNSQGGAGGGGGGGALTSGVNGSGASGAGSVGAGGAGGDNTAGTGASGTGAGSAVSPTTPSAGGSGYFGGGGGGGSATGNSTAGSLGGKSVHGGAGGSGRGAASGATSVFGGNGGGAGLAGSAPAGGGGSNAAGARGEVRVYVNG